MPVVFLDPDGDLTPLQWNVTPPGTHFSAIDDAVRDPAVPDLTDFIRDNVLTDVDVVSLEASPADYGSNNAIRVHAYGRASENRGMVVELRKADETVLSSATFAAGVDTTRQWKQGSDFVGALTQAEIDGLKIRHRITT